jgi:hypothetical protein
MPFMSVRRYSLLAAGVLISGVISAGEAAWNSQNTNGNPVVPGYFADPSIIYDSASGAFYIYSTTDGVWISYSGEPQVWHSTDFVQWECHPMTLPSGWPTTQLWAPSAMKHPTNGRYYLMYCSNSAVYIAYATSPLGPWTNAVSGTVLYSSGQLTGGSDWIDPQFFIDTNTVYFTFGQSSNMGIAKLAFNASYRASIDGSDPRMTDGTTYRCKRLSGLTNALEGSCMFRNGSTYFITYSNSACQNYNVQYAYASSPVGPFTHPSGQILARNNTARILGPGHNSILRYGSNWYICYHRQHYQYVDVKRQACIDRITVSGNTISTGEQSQEGVWAGSGSLETLVANARASLENDLAFGKTVLASSESAYKGGRSGNISETFAAISGFYADQYAVDRNFGTRWAPTTLPGYLIVDLGADYSVGRCETTFEYVMRWYRYRIHYLAASEASSITAAQSSSAWHLFADRSSNTRFPSPMVDTGRVTARYMRITVNSANLPTAADQIRTIIETDYADRVSIVEFKVFQSSIPVAVKSVGSGESMPARRHGIIGCVLAKAGNVTLKVFDVSGRTVYRREFNAPAGALSIKTAGLPLVRGIYCGVLTLPDGARGDVVRFVK